MAMQFRAPVKPIRYSGAAIVVRVGSTSSSKMMLSIPITLMSSGTAIASLRRPFMTPMASWSLYASTAVASSRAIWRAAPIPASTVGSFGPTRRRPAPGRRRLAQGTPADAVRPAGLRPCDVVDPFMTKGAQVLGSAADTPVVIVHHARDLGDDPVEQNHRLLLGHHPQGRVRHPGAGDDDAVDLLQLALDRLALHLGRLTRVREDQLVVRLARRLVRPLDDVAVEGIGDVRDEQSRWPAVGSAPRDGDRAACPSDSRDAPPPRRPAVPSRRSRARAGSRRGTPWMPTHRPPGRRRRSSAAVPWGHRRSPFGHIGRCEGDDLTTSVP